MVFIAEGSAESRTRARVRAAVGERGPITARDLSVLLGLTPAAVRRHLDALDADGMIAERDDLSTGRRGRGRPARSYVLTDLGQEQLATSYDGVANAALHFLAEHAGEQAVEAFAESQIAQLETRLRDRMERMQRPGHPNTGHPITGLATTDSTNTGLATTDAATTRAGGAETASGGPASGSRTATPTLDRPDEHDLAARTEALAEALSAEGFVASTRPVGQGTGLAGIQLCQGHCPIRNVAVEHRQFCDAETEAIGRLLGVHVQRLATLAGGEHVCTTFVPTGALGDGPTQAPSRKPVTTTGEGRSSR